MQPRSPKPESWASRNRVLLVVLIVVIVLIAFALAYVVLESVGVTVTSIHLTSTDNNCGQNGRTASGYKTVPHGFLTRTFTIVNPNPHESCTITTVRPLTPGFKLSDLNVPLTVSADGTAALSMIITSPGSHYDGVLTLDLE